MKPISLCWQSEGIMPAAEAKISVLDHGLLYGDGIFEGLRFYGNKVLDLEQHLARLQRSAQALALALPLPIEGIRQALEQLIEAYEEDQGYLRLLVTRGLGNLGLNPSHCPRPQLLIIVDQLSLSSSSAQEKGLHLITSSIKRLTSLGLDSRIKSLNYLPSILARLEANHAGADEALLLNERGYIAEASAENIFIETDQGLITPPAIDGALEGITRQRVINLAKRVGISVQEQSISPYDVFNAKSCFLTGTGAGLLPVASLDGRDLQQIKTKLFTQLQEEITAYIDDQIRQ